MTNDEIWLYKKAQEGGGRDIYSIEQGETQYTHQTPAVFEKDKLYLFFTGAHSGTFTNAKILAGNTSYFEIVSGIGIAVCLIDALSTDVSYQTGHDGGYFLVGLDTLKNGQNTDEVSAIDLSNSWEQASNVSSEIGKYYLLVDSVNNESGTLIGCDIIAEEKMTHHEQPLNINIRIVKATSSTISLSSGNNLYYRKFIFAKEI